MSYSRRHYDLLSNGRPDTPETIAKRIARRAASEQAHAETLARFAPLTAENAREAMAWQAARIVELTQTTANEGGRA